jgi:DNA-binding protein YbaB
MLSAQMQALADEAVAKYKEAIEREFETIDDAVDAKLEGKGEFSIHNLEISEGNLLKEGKEILDDVIAKAGYKAAEKKVIKKNKKSIGSKGKK